MEDNMSKTLQDILSEDLDFGATEKVASVSSSDNTINDEIDKLAMELGFDFGKAAEEDKGMKEDPEKMKEEFMGKKEEEKAEAEKKAAEDSMAMSKKEEEEKEMNQDEDKESKKEASMSLENLFNTLYPEDAQLNKTASEMEKEAASEAVGIRAFDYFSQRFDNRITKIAEDIKASTGTTSGIGEDASFPQELDRDSSPADQNAIGTDKKEGGEEAANAAERGNPASGEFSGDKLAMAMRKVMLQNALR